MEAISMKLSLIKQLLKNEISVEKFKGLIKAELREYYLKTNKKGSSILVSSEDDCDYYFGNNDLLQLCRLYLDGCLDETDLCFIADSITLSSSVTFESNELQEFLEEMTDPEINGEISKGRILEIMQIVQ
jgi:hypothetical protein